MLTPASLNAATRAYWRVVWVAYLPYVAVVIYSAQIARWLSSHHASLGIGGDSPFVILVPLILVAVPTLLLVFYIQRHTLCACPNCSKLIYPKRVPTVIATKCCTNCGESIVARQP
jgi:hypothetical protein